MKSSEIMPRMADLLEQQKHLAFQVKTLQRLDQTIKTNRQEVNELVRQLKDESGYFCKEKTYADYYQLLRKDRQLVAHYNALVTPVRAKNRQLEKDKQLVIQALQNEVAINSKVDYSRTSPKQRRLINEMMRQYNDQF